MSDTLPIGCVGLKGTDHGYAEIKRLWVAPAARGLRLGRRLMDAAEDAARGLGITLLRLDTNSACPRPASSTAGPAGARSRASMRIPIRICFSRSGSDVARRIHLLLRCGRQPWELHDDTGADLADLYRNYIACLNRQDWPALGQFVHDDVAHNAPAARPVRLSRDAGAGFSRDPGPALRHRAAGLRSAQDRSAAAVRLLAGRNVPGACRQWQGACPSAKTCSTNSATEGSGRSGR